jgi:hypothetical protein
MSDTKDWAAAVYMIALPAGLRAARADAVAGAASPLAVKSVIAVAASFFICCNFPISSRPGRFE